MFKLVLQHHADAANLAEVENLIQPDARKRHTFVVDERIADPARGQKRRAVLSFSGSNRGELLVANIMLSVIFDDRELSDTPLFIEALGWDRRRGRYNYYKLDTNGADGRMSWKFRGTSVGADLLAPDDRSGRCVHCHINGAPIMKELSLPWSNWHSSESQASYLLATADPQQRWSVATQRRLKDQLKSAEDLERGGIRPSITQFNRRRIEEAFVKRRDGTLRLVGGFAAVRHGRRLLRPLFETTEFNLISSRQKSGLHPFGPPGTRRPSADVVIPASVFLNADLIAGQTRANYPGLGIGKALELGQFTVTADEYRRLVTDAGVRLGGNFGDADFAWLVPEPSHIDNDLVDQLLRLGVVTRQFVAAVMSVGLETPVLSSERASLLAFVPDSFRFKPLTAASPTIRTAHPDDLAKQVIAALERSRPSTGSPAAALLAALKAADPVKRPATGVAAYHKRTADRLNGGVTRDDELRRLHALTLARRRAVLQHDVLGHLDETRGDRLLPLPAPQ